MGTVVSRETPIRVNERTELTRVDPSVANSLADAELAEDHFEDVLDIDAAGQPPQPGGGEAELLGDQFLAGTLLCQSPELNRIDCATSINTLR